MICLHRNCLQIRQHIAKRFYLKPSYKNQSSPESNLYRIPHECVTTAYRRKWQVTKIQDYGKQNCLSQGLLEKSQIFQYMVVKDHTIVWALPAAKQAKHKIWEIERSRTQATAKDPINKLSIDLSECVCHSSKGSKQLPVPAIWSSCVISLHLFCSTHLYPVIFLLPFCYHQCH